MKHSAMPLVMPGGAGSVHTSLAPLYVDMDGTLLSTDVFWELLVRLAKVRPTALLLAPFWLLKGKAFLKQQLSCRVSLNPANLPYHESVVAFVTRERALGRDVILATGSDSRVADLVARHVGVFSTVLASDGTVNLTGDAKLSAILEHAGGAPFDYIGNSAADLPIWRRALRPILVDASSRLEAKVRDASNAAHVLLARTPFLKNFLRMIRAHQWSKNSLLIVPLLLSHRVFDIERIIHVALAFVSFSLAASAVYIVNDLIDLDSDRNHPSKRRRPLAAGSIPIPVAVAFLPIAILASLAIAASLLPWLFTGILALYLVVTTAYTLKLKRIAIVDVLVLAGLYTLRVLAGGAATSVPVSNWFLAFSMFFFLSLAFVKRYAELRLSRGEGEAQDYLQARGYLLEDAQLLGSVGPASGYLAVVVLILYINSPDVLVLYPRPGALWLIGPLLLYWVTRVWFLAHRRQIHGDPVVFALTDRPSYILAAAIVALLIVGSLT